MINLKENKFKSLTLSSIENIKGGQGVPFWGLINPGCGPVLPNIYGYFASAAALYNAGVFGAPLIINGQGNNGQVCPAWGP
jgi:hypothetical protein